MLAVFLAAAFVRMLAEADSEGVTPPPPSAATPEPAAPRADPEDAARWVALGAKAVVELPDIDALKAELATTVSLGGELVTQINALSEAAHSDALRGELEVELEHTNARREALTDRLQAQRPLRAELDWLGQDPVVALREALAAPMLANPEPEAADWVTRCVARLVDVPADDEAPVSKAYADWVVAAQVEHARLNAADALARARAARGEVAATRAGWLDAACLICDLLRFEAGLLTQMRKRVTTETPEYPLHMWVLWFLSAWLLARIPDGSTLDPDLQARLDGHRRLTEGGPETWRGD